MSSVFNFPDRATGFIPERLVEARLVSQMSRAELARQLDMTGQAIGYYESGDRCPDMSILLRIADVLKQPVTFFLRPSPQFENLRGTRFFRSFGTRSNKLNYALDIKAKWLWEIITFMRQHIRLPKINLPEVEPPANHVSYSLPEIENIATAVRKHWELGNGPIANVVALFETHGVIVTRFELGSEKIDAFSSWIDQRPYVFLGSDKKSSARSRFDAAHELGHLLLHRDISQEDLEQKSVRDRVESEANMFAGSFLLPRDSLLKEFYSTRMRHLLGLKERWRVSLQALAHRNKDIGAIDEDQYILFRKTISYRKWITEEPLDDVIPLEQPKWLLNCWNLLVQKNIIHDSGLEEETGFSLDLVARLFGVSSLRDHDSGSSKTNISN